MVLFWSHHGRWSLWRLDQRLRAPRTLAGFPGGLLEDLLLVEALLGLLLFVGAVEHRPAGQHKHL